MIDCIIVDDLPPEAVAMLQALYSRSPKSVREHLAQVRERGADKFMSQFYVGYGHKSIGDCGSTSIFIENVSLLAAKAIQDNPLYNGQEASTRYLDMSRQSLVSPFDGSPLQDVAPTYRSESTRYVDMSQRALISPGIGTSRAAVAAMAIQASWMQLYEKVLQALIPSLKERFPIKTGEKETVWEKAIKAKAFDIARGFLPAGVTTFVAWHTNLRQAHDHLKIMKHSPLEEVREIAAKVHAALLAKYPSSFGHKPQEGEDEYLAKSVAEFAFLDEMITTFGYENNLDMPGLMEHHGLLATRPPKTELHQRFRQYGQIQFWFGLDFGSYRDLQRQRSAVQEMPLLSTKLGGFHRWYLDQLPEPIKAEALDMIVSQEAALEKLEAPQVVKQYYTAIGYTVPVQITCSLPAAVYIAELRSSTTVHPTLRVVAQQMGETLKEVVPGLAMHHDMSPDEWSTKRGTQDIVKKEQ